MPAAVLELEIRASSDECLLLPGFAPRSSVMLITSGAATTRPHGGRRLSRSFAPDRHRSKRRSENQAVGGARESLGEARKRGRGRKIEVLNRGMRLTSGMAT